MSALLDRARVAEDEVARLAHRLDIMSARLRIEQENAERLFDLLEDMQPDIDETWERYDHVLAQHEEVRSQR